MIDVDGDLLIYVVFMGFMFGILSLLLGGVFIYIFNSEYIGVDSFSYIVFDGIVFVVIGFIDIMIEVLEVFFNDIVRMVFIFDVNVEFVSVNGWEYIEDVNLLGNFDDLLDN